MIPNLSRLRAHRVDRWVASMGVILKPLESATCGKGMGVGVEVELEVEHDAGAPPGMIPDSALEGYPGSIQEIYSYIRHHYGNNNSVTWNSLIVAWRARWEGEGQIGESFQATTDLTEAVKNAYMNLEDGNYKNVIKSAILETERLWGTEGGLWRAIIQNW